MRPAPETFAALIRPPKTEMENDRSVREGSFIREGSIRQFSPGPMTPATKAKTGSKQSLMSPPPPQAPVEPVKNNTETKIEKIPEAAPIVNSVEKAEASDVETKKEEPPLDVPSPVSE